MLLTEVGGYPYSAEKEQSPPGVILPGSLHSRRLVSRKQDMSIRCKSKLSVRHQTKWQVLLLALQCWRNRCPVLAFTLALLCLSRHYRNLTAI